MTVGTFSAVIVDDEPLAVEGIRRLCVTSGRVRIAGEACDGRTAIELIDRVKPQAVFLDIAMPGMNGLAVAAALRGMSAPPQVVLVTANDHFATEAFDLAVVDYVLKPIDPERMMRAIERVFGLVATHVAKTDHAGALWVPYRGTVVRLSVADIHRIEAERDYVRVYDAERSYLLRATLSDLADRLTGRFVRIHRSMAIARDGVVGLRHAGGGSWIVIDAAGTEFSIGRTYLAGVRAGLRIEEARI